MSAPTLSPLRKGFAEATGQAQAHANPFGIPKRKKSYASSTLAALLVFAVVNLVWSIFYFGRLSADDFPFPTWTSCAVNDYLHERKEPPNLAFLGSSLVLFPAGCVDADFLEREIDGPRHHHSLYFEDQFRRKTGQPISTFDFALPGEMPSDAYFISKFLFRGARKPQVIVYGVGPRDFMDNLLPSPSATDPFQHLARFGDFSDHIAAVSPGWQERLSWELGCLIYPYGHKVDLAHLLERTASHLVAWSLHGLPAIDIYARRTLLPGYRPFEVGVNECRFRPSLGNPRPPFKDNLAEYRKRYKYLNWDTFLTQMDFLAETMEVAHERGISFVLVSMPITDLNRELISPLAKEAYAKTLHVLAKAKGAKFIDFDNRLGYRKDYEISDFEDTVHLNSLGGRKMLESLAFELASDTDIRRALGSAAGVRSSDRLVTIHDNLMPAAWRHTLSSVKKKALSTTERLATRKESCL